MLEIGRLCTKTKGRESGNIAVIVDVIDNNFVVIDGNVRRKKCSISHLEPLDKKLDIEKNASSQDVKKELSTLGYTIIEKKSKEKAKDQKISDSKEKENVKDSKKLKKSPKKETKKNEKK